MSDALPNDTPREKSALRKPLDGRCPICKTWVGSRGLRFEHCHFCKVQRGWACEPCNKAYTEHVQTHWEAWKAFFESHHCCPEAALFEIPPAVRLVRERPTVTRPLRLSNGGGDDRIVNVSARKGMFTIEQVAVACGVNTATARDWFNGRKGLARPAKQIDGTYLVHADELLALIEERIQKGLQ